ncbi:hypothetical protein [Fischerella sp. FACHB-380]|uniref:hypothetical protein n=1 Tax=Fischerella sp. FACHB-380 TaxID=2692799 RepID=UPI0030DAD781
MKSSTEPNAKFTVSWQRSKRFGWLLIVGCWLLIVGCWLLVVGGWLLIVGGWLLVVSS